MIISLVIGFRITSYGSPTLPEILLSEGFTQAKVKNGANRVFVTAKINSHDLTLLVDTGSATTVISRESAKANGIKEGRLFGSYLGVNGVDDEKSTEAVINSFSISGVELNRSPVIIINFKSDREDRFIKYDGLLGISTMKTNHALFSYTPALFFFNPQHAASRQIASLLHSARFAELAPPFHRPFYILPLFINGAKADTILDSGSPYTTIDTEFAYDHHIKEIPLIDSVFLNGIEGKESRLRAFKPKSLSISTYTLPTIEIAGSRFECFKKTDQDQTNWVIGLLGFDIIGQLNGLLDTGNDRLYLRKVPSTD